MVMVIMIVMVIVTVVAIVIVMVMVVMMVSSSRPPQWLTATSFVAPKVLLTGNLCGGHFLTNRFA
jgi:hypothetical protein